MKYLKTIELIDLLKAQGNSVQYKKRTDGGYFITNINGRKFSGSKGNTYARNLTGSPLPSNLLKQRIIITKVRERKYKAISKSVNKTFKETKKVLKKLGLKNELPYQTRKELLDAIEKNGKKVTKEMLKSFAQFGKLSKSFTTQFEKTRQAIENNKNIKGKVSIKITMDSIRKYGVREVKRKLKSMQLYAEGWARDQNIYWLIMRIKEVEIKFQKFELDRVITYLRNHKIKDRALKTAYDEVYKIDKGEIPINDDTANLLIAILKQ